MTKNHHPYQFTYRITKFDNYDGDSINLLIDLGFALQCYKKCRLLGIDTPEMHDHRPTWKEAAVKAKQFVHQYMSDGIQAQEAGTGMILFLSEEHTGKFGRALGNIARTIDGKTDNLRDRLLDEHLGVPYHGENKSDVAAAHQRNIQWLIKNKRLV